MPDFQAGFGNLGSAVQDLFGASGAKKAAKGYGTAAKLTEQTIGLTKLATRLNTLRQRREAYRVLGGQAADVAASGFAASGTALDLARSSRQEAELDSALIGLQGQIEVTDLTTQAALYRQKQSEKKSESSGGFFSAVLKIGASVASFLL